MKNGTDHSVPACIPHAPRPGPQWTERSVPFFITLLEQQFTIGADGGSFSVGGLTKKARSATKGIRRVPCLWRVRYRAMKNLTELP